MAPTVLEAEDRSVAGAVPAEEYPATDPATVATASTAETTRNLIKS